MNNTFMQDKRLNATAIGILAVILSNKDDWVVYPDEIAKRLHTSRKTVDKHLALLEETGYMFVIKKHLGRGKGKEYHRFFSDVPMTDIYKEYLKTRFENQML